MNISLLDDPFPHVVCSAFFTDEELAEIWEEIHFLAKPQKIALPGIYHGAGEGGNLTRSRAICLEEVYREKNVSNILKLFNKALSAPIVSVIKSRWPSFSRLALVDRIVTKLRYYHDGDYYAPHTDITQEYLLFAYFHSEPKRFSGGELNFPAHDYSFDCSHNSLIILPSYVEHEVTRISIEDDDYWSGRGRYCISQFLTVRQPEGYIKHA